MELCKVSACTDEKELRDEDWLDDAVDFGEWAAARKSRDESKNYTPDNSSCLGWAFMTWMVSVVKKGWHTELQRSDLPGLRQRYLSKEVYPEFKRHYDALEGKEMRFQKALFKVPSIRHTLWVGSIFSSVQGLLGTVARPLVLDVVLRAIEQGTETSTAVGYVLMFAAVVFFEGWAGVVGRQMLSEEFGTQFQNCASSAVYSKMLRINVQKVQTDRSSESSLIGNDVVRAYENIRVAANFPMAIAGVIGGIVVLLVLIGTSSLVGIATMLAIMILNMVISKVTHGIEQRNLRAADERLSVMSAVIEGVRAVKLFGWEISFKKRIKGIREEECKHIRNYRLAHVFSIVSGRASPVLSSMATLVFYAMSGEELTIAKAYATVTVFQALRLGLIYIPLSITSVMAFDVTLKRLNAYFKREERAPGKYLAAPEKQGDVLAAMDDANLGWGTPETTEENSVAAQVVLKNVSMKVYAGQVVGVVGRVGGGKSTLLSSVVQAIAPLGDDTTESSVHTVKDIGYAPQKPFVVCGTIKQNILLGRPFDQEKLNGVLKRSGLASDVKLFPNGIQTEIGERGTTLSGGQQSRLAVARALYGDPDLLVLDDPLSAVDSKVCNHMFDKAILQHVVDADGGRRVKGCLMALNQLSLLPRLDWIVFLDQGQISAQGTYQDLLNRCAAFQTFMTTLTTSQEGEGEEEEKAGAGKERGEAGGFSPSHQSPGPQFVEDASLLERRPMSALSHDTLETTESSKQAVAAAVGGKGSSILAGEQLTKGNISKSVYLRFIRSIGTFFFTTCALLSLVGYVVMAINDYWLTLWSEALEADESDRNLFYAGVYAALSVSFGVLILTASWLLCFGGVRASKALHDTMLDRLLSAPMYWFEGTATGRILSRFSGDLSKVDMILPLAVDNFIQVLATLAVLLATLCIAVPLLTVVVLVTGILFCYLLVALDRSSRKVRRMSNDSMSPLLSNATEAVRGREMILVMNCGPFFEARHRLASDEYARCNFVAGSVINWGMLGSQVLSFIVSVSTATLLVALHEKFPTNLVGISLAYAFVIPYFAAITIQTFVRMNSFFTSFERLLEYDQLPQETQYFSRPKSETGDPTSLYGINADEDGALSNEVDDPNPSPQVWPTKGEVGFKNVNMRYRTGLPLVLKDVTFSIPAHSSVGICGKTGAGKSSLISVLFRLVEVQSGAIVIDGRDISTISLDTLRKTLTIIPQDPILMEGTVRSNLDPFEDYTMQELENALDLVGLMGQVLLDDPVEDGGRNWSCGERQLLSFARALLRPSPILILDEPTSSIDTRTDELIQRMVKDEFMVKRRSTVLTIAHRLNTICDYDYILVMQKGGVKEMDSPRALLQNTSSEFFSMVDALGPVGREKILSRVGLL